MDRRSRHSTRCPPRDVSVRFADGHTASIWEKWIEITRFSAFWNTWEPGAVGPDHGHNGDHSVLILAGEVRCAATGS